MLREQGHQVSGYGPGARVDIRSLTGLRGRLLYSERLRSGGLTPVPCTVQKADRSEIHIQLQGAAKLTPGSAVILEVTGERALIQCFTSVVAQAHSGEVRLQTPAAPHVLQRRRFPRIDVFVGITIQTPDRPVEAVAAQMINLSQDGAACVLAEPVPPGTEITLNLTSLGLYPPEAAGLVLRCTPTPTNLWLIGLQFQRLRPEQELYLGKYISDFLERQDAPSASKS